jgi:hypothetical protein
MQNIWLSPTDFVTGDPSLQISYPSDSDPNTILTSTVTGGSKLISMGLRLPPNVKIEEVTICYQVSNSDSFISQLRLVEMDTPDHAVVRHTDETDLKSTSPERYSSKVAGFVPTAAVSLELRLHFQDNSHQVLLGAVGITLEPSAWPCVNVSDFGAIGQTLTTSGNVVVGSPDVTVNTSSGWVVGAGVEVDAGGGDIFRARVTAVTGNVLRLFPAPGFRATGAATITNDDSVPIQAAYEAVKATGGKICIPPGRYRCADTLNLNDNKHRVVFEGTADRNFPENSLEFTRATGHLVTLYSAHDVSFRQIKFAYANTAYAGDLVDLDWSDPQHPSDPAYVDFDDCTFTGTTSVKNARSLLRLNRAIICSVRRCGFLWTNIGILGQDGAYSNAHTITECAFNFCDGAAIKNPGEAWTIINCTFEPDSYGRASGIDHDPKAPIGPAYGLTIIGGWFGDAKVAGKCWITAKTLGMALVGARMGQAGPDVNDGCLKLLEGCQGVTVLGGALEGTGIILPEGNHHVLGLTVIGTDFNRSPKPIINKVNAFPLAVWGCAGLSSIASYGVNAGNGGVTFDPANMITMGFSSRLPVDQPTGALLWLDAATHDYLGIASFTHGTLGIMPRSDIANSEVVLFAGRDPTSKRPITVAHLGVNKEGHPYMKGPFAMPTYTSATRPPPGDVEAGSAIFNTTTNKPNWSNGEHWFDANGIRLDPPH